MTNYTAYTDHELIKMLTESDHQAFTEIYARYWDKLYAAAFKRTSNHHDAEEIVQAVFVNLWNRRKKIQLKYTLYTYLAAAIQYEVIDLRAVRHKNAAIQHAQMNSSARMEPLENTVTNQIDFNELLTRMQDTINALPEKCRLIFLKSREQESTYRQIAEELNISEKAVEKQISKALRRLRTGLTHLFMSLL